MLLDPIGIVSRELAQEESLQVLRLSAVRRDIHTQARDR
jgi:hypothetical protein